MKRLKKIFENFEANYLQPSLQANKNSIENSTKNSNEQIKTEQTIQKELTAEEIFEEIPVDFRTFVEHPAYMSFPPLSEKQYEVADFMLGNDPSKIFTNGNYLAVLLFGKGSGKDTIAALIISYIVYVLLCMKDPQKYFNFPPAESIDLVNCAASGNQAASIFFEKFKQRILHWKWLANKYNITQSGAYIRQVDFKQLDKTVLITKNGIIFPKYIRAFSGHSKETSVEGLNLLCFVLDEAAAFKDSKGRNNADVIFESMVTSASTRFGLRYKGFILSYPRYAKDFICRMYEWSLGQLHVYSGFGATWEIKPRHFFSPQTFKFEEYEIPIDFKDDFERNPISAKSKFLCLPPDSAFPFIENSAKISACIDTARKPIIEVVTSVGEYIQKQIVNYSLPFPQPEYIMTIDLGLKNNSAACGIYHLDKNTGVIIQDFIDAWIPDEEHKVSFIDVKNFIEDIKKHLNLVGVYFDQWNSAYLIEALQALNIPAFEYRLTFQDYRNMKERIYNQTISLLYNAQQIQELKELQLIKDKVDHPVDGSKDMVDTICGAIKILGAIKINVAENFAGEFITPNLEIHGTFI